MIKSPISEEHVPSLTPENKDCDMGDKVMDWVKNVIELFLQIKVIMFACMTCTANVD